MLTVRLRTRDGTERISVSQTASVGDLRAAVGAQIGRPPEQFVLSTNQALLTSKDTDTFFDLSDDAESLQDNGFKNGQWVYCYYDGTREVAPGYKRSKFDDLPFGAHMDIPRLMEKQVRIERQDEPTVSAASIDRFAAHSFQAYVQSAVNFSIQRGAVLYGRVDEDAGEVYVDVAYEPPQQGSAERLELDTECEEAHRAEAIAAALGLKKVGLLFNQSAGERDYIMNDSEIALACRIQAEVGEHGITAVFMQQEEEDGSKEVHLEVFQCSKQAVQLYSDGWIVPPAAEGEASGLTRMRNPHDASIKLPVMISGKDTDEVDNDFWLVPLAVKDHQGPWMQSFPVENRLTGQASNDLKAHMDKYRGKAYSERLADFHLLLWLSTHLHWQDEDIAQIVEAVKEKEPIMEGYTLMIDSMAGM